LTVRCFTYQLTQHKRTIPLTLFNDNLSRTVLAAYCRTYGREIISRNLALRLCNKHEGHDAHDQERGRFVLRKN